MADDFELVLLGHGRRYHADVMSRRSAMQQCIDLRKAGWVVAER
jgi:hypothetical protein